MYIIINQRRYPVQLEQNATAQAFVSLLPLVLDMEELNGNEKYVYLGEHLPSEPQCPGMINAGDIMLFGSNCVVVFYESFRTHYAYSRIGRVLSTEGLRLALGKSNVKVAFE
uniref:Cyclophilin-like fold protein n=5 Tax=unclassified Prevotella TaxID=2638335 RepID=A0AB33JHD9_9BACT